MFPIEWPAFSYTAEPLTRSVVETQKNQYSKEKKTPHNKQSD